ncbi:adenosine deaminase [Plantactinospora sp. GCM10030261]|uniref:adenosine deaminase n=1 Tax=Plantactinospora sp. GCM10030261 TaxID=3273420 RepID=UPI00361EA327
MRDVITLPKPHLHVHLESAVRLSTLAEIGADNGVDLPAHLSDGGYAFTDFADFFQQNDLVRRCLRRPEDFRRIAAEFCADQAADGVRYVEVSFTAAAHGERLGDLEMPLAAVLAGLAEGQAAHDITCRVILDHSRRRSVERAWRTLDLAVRYADRGVVAVGLAGDEAYPVDPFVEVFAAARDRGLRIVHHAGEAAGADSIRRAVAAGGAERIGHGIRAVDDPDLMAWLRDQRIPLEVCPSSNVALGFAASRGTHPLPRLVEAGLLVTLNTDIPAMIGTTLSAEYTHLRTGLGWSDEALAELARAGTEASFAPTVDKRRLRAGIDDWLTGRSAGQ